MEFLLTAASIMLGLMVGSFLNVVIYRVPRGTFLKGGKRSHCPSCASSIAWYDNIPVLSYLLLRGKARCCDKRISIQYPLVEFGTALSFWLLYRYLPPPLWRQGFSFDTNALLVLLLNYYFISSLIAASVIDLHHRILPNAINFLGAGVGMLAAVLLPGIHVENWLFLQLTQFTDMPTEGQALVDALAGGMLGGGSLYAVAAIGRVFYGREAMGLGDVKFMIFTGTFLGPGGVLLALLIACFLGAFIGLLASLKSGDPLIPFGPFLAIGVVGSWYAGDPLAKFVLEDWPRWLRESPFGLPTLIGFSILCLIALFYLRRLRRR